MATISGGGSWLSSLESLNPFASAAPAAPPKPKANPQATLQRADKMMAAPPAPAAVAPTNKAPQGLDVIPKSWLPDGHTQRGFKAKTGFIQVAKGTADINRDRNNLSIKTPYADFSFKNDPKHPGKVLAHTSQKGDFVGTLKLDGDTLECQADDGKHSLKIQKEKDYVRFDTEGFGVYDKGHLEVANQ